MAHELYRLTNSVYNTPLLVDQETLQGIESYLNSRNMNDIEMALNNNKRDLPREELPIENGVGVLSVKGALHAKAHMFEAFCGMTSYETLLSRTAKFCESDEVKVILMDLESGGGDGLNLVYTSREIKRLCNESGKKLIGYVNGSACSAAFGLASACDELIVSTDSTVGSIGVLLALRNSHKYEEDKGVSTTYITAGSEKIPFDKETKEFRGEFLADLQERVDELYGRFTQLVADQRGMELQDVIDTQAKVFSAEKAVELGLADKIMNPTEFYDYLATLSDENLADASASKDVNYPEKDEDDKTKTERQDEETLMSDNTNVEASVELQAQLDAITAQAEADKAQMADMMAQLEAFKAKEVADTKEKLSAEFEGMEFLADNKEAVVDFMMSADEANADLMRSVIASAQEGIVGAKAEADEAKEEADKQVEDAKAEMEEVKEEFATSEHSIQGEVKEELQGSFLARNLAKAKAQKAQ